MMTKRAATPGRLRRRMRPMRWIIWRRVRLALMTMPRFASGTSMPSSSTRGAATASSLRTRRSSRISRRWRRAVEPVMRSIETQRIEAVDRVVRGAHRLGEHERAVGALDRGREARRAARTCRSSAPRSGVAWRTRRDSRARRGRRRRRRARRGARPRRGSRRTVRAACRAPGADAGGRSRAVARSRCTRLARRPRAATPTNATRGGAHTPSAMACSKP